MHTNKEILNQGIKKTMWSLPCFFIGPAIIHFAYINQLQPTYLLILGLGIAIAIAAMVFLFMGLKTIMKALFGN